jgi:non-heme chloroperoxidase
MPTVKTNDGVTLHYTADGDGRTMLFISGWSMSGEWFVRQRRHFAATHRVIILDTRAQGKVVDHDCTGRTISWPR